MEWFRCYTRTLDSAKVQGLPLELFKAWFNLCCLARVHDGPLPSLKEISFRLRVTEQKAQYFVTSLEAVNLIDKSTDGTFYMHDWDEHQRVSDNVAARVAKHRAKQVGNVTETFSPARESRAEQSRAEQKDQKHVATATAERAEEFQLSPDPPSAVRPDVPAGPTFEDWWKVYWNHDAKKAGKKAWEDIAKRRGPQFLINQAIAYRQRFEETDKWEFKSKMLPATWLRGERWNDQAPPSARGEPARKLNLYNGPAPPVEGGL